MTHDPMCPFRPAPPEEYAPIEVAVACQCDLIARVRAETLDKAREAIEAINPGVLYRVDGYEALAAIDALRGES